LFVLQLAVDADEGVAQPLPALRSGELENQVGMTAALMKEGTGP